MGRRAKPPKGTADAKRQLARKSPKDEDSRVRDLEKRLADALQREAGALGRLQTRNRELAEAQEQQTATSEILRVIASSPTDAEPVFATILASALALCGGARGAVFTSDGERLYLGAGSSIAPDVVQRYPMPLSRNTLSGRAILDNTVVHVPDVEAPEAVSAGSLTVSRLVGYRSALVAPMVRDGRSIGAIFLGRREPGPFGEKHIALLQTFADQAVIAIENVRLFKELEARNRDLTTALDRQTATADVLRIIARSPTELQPVLEAIAESAVRLCAASDAVIERLEGDRFYNAAHAGNQMKGLVGLPLPLTRRFPGGRAVLDRRRVIIDDIHLVAEREYPDTLELLKLNTIHSVAEIPLLSEGKPLGTIAVLRAEVRPFTDAEVTLLETFADQAVIAIENVRLFKELEARNRDLTQALDQQTATSEILRVIGSVHTDAQPVFDTIVLSAARLCNAANAALFRVEAGMLYHPANYGGSPEALAAARARYPRPVDMDSAPGHAILTRSPVQIPDIEDPSLTTHVRQAGQVLGFRSCVAVPMLSGGEAVGALLVTRRTAGVFSDAEVELLRTFADQAVIAIENVRLFTALEARNRDLTAALEQQTATGEILRVISSSPTDEKPVFDAIARSSVRLCGAAFSVVAILDADEVLHLVASEHVGTEGRRSLAAAYPMRPNRGQLAGRAILDRAVVHVADVTLDPEYVGAALGNRATLSVPMLRKVTPIGTITIGRFEPMPFTDQQIELLKTFADQAVIAIENVRLFTELQSSNRNLTTALDQRTATSEVLRTIAQTKTDLQPVFDTIVQSAARLCHAANAAVFLTDGRMVYEPANFGSSPEALAATRARFPRPVGMDSTPGIAILTRSVFHVPDIEDPSVIEHLRQSGRLVGFRSVVTVPMLREGEAVGALLVARPEPGRFSDPEVQLLKTFADQAVIAIENVRLLRDLEVANRQLQAASQHKSEFLANMSHELRTPLNAIIGFSEVLSERMFGDLNEKQDEYLKDIHASGQHLLSLINDILDLSKIEAGRMALEVTDFDLPMAINNALMLVRERAARRSIALHTTIDERLGQLQADERKIRQVLLNLLSNAIKFTPEGGRIEVGAVPRDRSVEISVSDTGVGIAPEDQEAVFEEFRQVGAAEKKVEGTGLGLALSRKFIELHGGRIWVKSQVGAGSTFTFTIPVRCEPSDRGGAPTLNS